jgi:hypothetical protein
MAIQKQAILALRLIQAPHHFLSAPAILSMMQKKVAVNVKESQQRGTLSSLMRNKFCRFVFFFVLGVPFNFVISYVHVWLFGYHKMGPKGYFIISLWVATYATFILPWRLKQRLKRF